MVQLLLTKKEWNYLKKKLQRSKNKWLLKLIAFSFFAGVFKDNPIAIVFALLFIIPIFLILKD